MGNRVKYYGGAITAQINVTVTMGMTRSTTQHFVGNEAAFGGVVYFQSGGALTMNGSTFFTNNRATSGGALNVILGGKVIMNGRTFFNRNHAYDGGASFRSSVTFPSLGTSLTSRIHHQKLMVEECTSFSRCC